MSTDNPFAAPEESSFGYDDTNYENRSYGGIGRGAYFLYSFLIGIVNNGFQYALANAGQDAFALLLALAGLVISLILGYQRLVNLGYSGWWLLGFFVPILNLLVGLRCLAAPEGYADHKTLDSTAKMILGLFFGLIALVVVAVVMLS